MSKLVDLVGLSRFLSNLDNRFIGVQKGSFNYENSITFSGDGIGLLCLSDPASTRYCILLINLDRTGTDAVEIISLSNSISDSEIIAADPDAMGESAWIFNNLSSGELLEYTFIPLCANDSISVIEGGHTYDIGYVTIPIKKMATTDDNKVFVATYGTTTYQEIVDAYNAGKIPIVIRNSALYVLASSDLGNQAFFVANVGLEVLRVKCTKANAWSADTVSVENRLRKVTTTPTSTDLTSTDKYPSMKIMADYVDEKLGDIETLLSNI